MNSAILANTIIIWSSFDPYKGAASIAKCGLSLADAPVVFDAPDKLTLASPRGDEARLLDVAIVEMTGVVLALVCVLREPDEVRAISLRRASKTERNLHASWQETH